MPPLAVQCPGLEPTLDLLFSKQPHYHIRQAGSPGSVGSGRVATPGRTTRHSHWRAWRARSAGAMHWRRGSRHFGSRSTSRSRDTPTTQRLWPPKQTSAGGRHDAPHVVGSDADDVLEVREVDEAPRGQAVAPPVEPRTSARTPALRSATRPAAADPLARAHERKAPAQPVSVCCAPAGRPRVQPRRPPPGRRRPTRRRRAPRGPPTPGPSRTRRRRPQREHERLQACSCNSSRPAAGRAGRLRRAAPGRRDPRRATGGSPRARRRARARRGVSSRRPPARRPRAAPPSVRASRAARRLPAPRRLRVRSRAASLAA